MSDLFVGNKYMHTFFRFVAAFIIAPILIYYGYTLNNIIILGIGIMTLIIDTYTFILSIKKI